MAQQKEDYFRGADGKISDKKMSPYGKRTLAQMDGAELHFTDAVLIIKGNKLVNEQGEVVENINNDRLVNKIVFRILTG